MRDTTSGFRAFSQDAAVQLHVFNDYTYTLETIIQVGLKGVAVVTVPVRVNPDLRLSRLLESIPSYVRRQLLTIVRIVIVYKSCATFPGTGGATFSLGFLIGLRFLCHQGRGRSCPVPDPSSASHGQPVCPRSDRVRHGSGGLQPKASGATGLGTPAPPSRMIRVLA